MSLGKYGGAQYPSGFIPSFTSPLAIVYANFNIPAAATDAIMTRVFPDGTFNNAVVPQGEVWVLADSHFRETGTIPATSEVILLKDIGNTGGGFNFYYPFHGKKAPVTLEWYHSVHSVVAFPGDSIRINITAATAGNDMHAFIHGYVQALVGI